ncbi:MAG: hypothetical protein LBB46_02320 [Coriobacteriaceae bacterium]|jgi:hypothetical protein|nr:hypothetical protein [Coriobacteriaceae bacterium]
MAHPCEIDVYDEATKRLMEFHEKRIVELEYGKDSKLSPDLARPCYLFRKREDTLCKMLV